MVGKRAWGVRREPGHPPGNIVEKVPKVLPPSQHRVGVVVSSGSRSVAGEVAEPVTTVRTFDGVIGQHLSLFKDTEVSGVAERNVIDLHTVRGPELRVEGKLFGVKVSMLVDTGSMVSVVSSRLTSRKENWSLVNPIRVSLVDGSTTLVNRGGIVRIYFPGLEVEQEMIEMNIKEEVILGMDFLNQNVKSLDLVRGRLTFVRDSPELNFTGTKGLYKIIKENSEVVPEFDVAEEFSDIFVQKGERFGRTALVEHEIETGTANPIRQRPRRLPVHKFWQAEQEIKKMCELGVIERSNSPWCSPVVLVTKKSGDVRFCIDYRALNEVTKKDCYPLPNLMEALECLEEACWFSVLDLRSGYWQIKMSEHDKEKTAFSIGKGLWQFTVMPFGLCNAVATFQRLMEKVLTGLVPKCCVVYVDDILVFGKELSEARDNLKLVLGRLKEAGLTLAGDKCKILQNEVKFLGHVINGDGIAMDPDKIKIVSQWPEPKNVRELRGFLGLTGYYRRFIRDYAEITEPLNRLLESARPFEFRDQQREAMQTLVEALTSEPILIRPDLSKEFIVDADASDIGIGVVLSQRVDGYERVVSYYGKGLTRNERNYCTTRKELLALVKGLKKFRHYLLGKPFVVRTDHSALQWLRNFKEPEGQVARWLEMLQEYDFVVCHRKGKMHQNADALSRRPCMMENCKSCLRKEERWGINRMVIDVRWEINQNRDPVISTVLGKMAEVVERPNMIEMGPMDKELLTLWGEWNSLKIIEGVLYRKVEKKFGDIWQLVIPKENRLDVLKEAHAGRSSGHLGSERTFERIRARFYWPGYRSHVDRFCASCRECLSRNPPGKYAVMPLGLRVVGRPFERVAIDILGPLRISRRGHRYILVISDYFTKWVEAFPMVSQEAPEVVTKLCEEFVCRFGVPSELHSDQGRNFESLVMAQMCELLGIRKTRTTPFRPQSDGMVERFNRTLAEMLTKVIERSQENWDDCLPYVMLAYRTSVHSSTGFSPASVLLGLEPRLPLDLMVPSLPMEEVMYGEFVANHKEHLEIVRNEVRVNLREVGRKMKARFDVGINQPNILVGDRVWVLSTTRVKGLSQKLRARWRGPFEVLKVINEQLVRVRMGRKHSVMHRSRLKKDPGRPVQPEFASSVTVGSSADV